MTRRSLGFALVRFALGLMFLLYGVGKLRDGVSSFVSAMLGAFEGSFVPAVSVRIFSSALPALELLIGLGLILGLCTTLSLGVGAGTTLVLLAGTVILGDTTAAAHNVFFVVIFAVLLTERDHEPSLDRLLPPSPLR